MARIDKYEPLSGGHRAALAADWLDANIEEPIGVGLDGNGRVVVGAGNTGIIGVVVLTKKRYAGDVVDVMQDGELVECAGLTTGTVYYADSATGVLDDTAPAAGTNAVKVGHTVEATRLVVRLQQVQG